MGPDWLQWDAMGNAARPSWSGTYPAFWMANWWVIVGCRRVQASRCLVLITGRKSTGATELLASIFIIMRVMNRAASVLLYMESIYLNRLDITSSPPQTQSHLHSMASMLTANQSLFCWCREKSICSLEADIAPGTVSCCRPAVKLQAQKHLLMFCQKLPCLHECLSEADEATSLTPS